MDPTGALWEAITHVQIALDALEEVGHAVESRRHGPEFRKAWLALQDLKGDLEQELIVLETAPATRGRRS